MPHIELLGLARRYAGVEEFYSAGTTLEQLLRDLGSQCPGFLKHCPAGECLPLGLIVCVNERHFTTDLTETIQPHDRVLILSADVGG